MTDPFQALLLREAEGRVTAAIETLSDADLPPGPNPSQDVTVAVEYSTLNYKDGMILGGLGRLVRSYPHVPGIDFAGTVLSSADPRYSPGDKVVLTGWRVGEVQWGGFAQRARVNADWLVPMPGGLSTKDAMAIGTAGFTAMLAVMELERHGLEPGAGPVLVTGAAGGVGSAAIALLSHLGHAVTAVSGRPETADYLRGLGATDVIPRSALADPTKRPLEAEMWAGAIDSVGSTTLARLLGQMRYRAPVAACGLAGGADLPATVVPFLLRGIRLLGIDSVMQPYGSRLEAWARLARDLPLDRLAAMTETCGLADLPAKGADILQGRIRGRLVIDVNA